MIKIDELEEIKDFVKALVDPIETLCSLQELGTEIAHEKSELFGRNIEILLLLDAHFDSLYNKEWIDGINDILESNMDINDLRKHINNLDVDLIKTWFYMYERLIT